MVLQDMWAQVRKDAAECARRGRTLRSLSWTEVSGSLGDLGTYIPLVIGVSVTNSVNFASTLVFTGLLNIATGLLFDVPMAVQPMKAVAAVALSSDLTPQEIMAGGMFTSLFVLVLGVTGLIDTFNRVVPFAVVRGLQLGLGLVMLKKAAGLAVFDGDQAVLPPQTLVVSSVLFLATFLPAPRVPLALLYFVGGMVWAVVKTASSDDNQLDSHSSTPFYPSPLSFKSEDWSNGFVKAAIPQIPLTTLNSVIAVCRLSDDLFPHVKTTTPRRVSTSVGVMNLVQCWFNAMPMCHGAGGLAGQFRCGARSSASILFLGLCKLVVGVFLGGICLEVLKEFPGTVLGVLLAMSALELASSCRDQTEKESSLIMLATAGSAVAFNSNAHTKTVSSALGAAIGFSVALVVHLSARLEARWRDTPQRRTSGSRLLDANEDTPNPGTRAVDAQVSKE